MRKTSCCSFLLLSTLAMASVSAQGTTESFSGYAEWRKGPDLVVDGQRVRATSSTKFKGAGEARDFAGIPLGYEVTVVGTRQANGVVQATKIEAKPNGTAMFEKELVSSTQQLEAFLVAKGLYPGEPEDRRLLAKGLMVDRVKRISIRLIPPYRSKDDFRCYVVETDEWNAAAYPNGMIIVNEGLLRDMDDDEVALVLGHEIAHATHEHSRRGKKRDLWVGLAAAAGSATVSELTSGTSRAAALQAIGLTGAATSSGYGRDLEDQADRVGLRYAYEGGFDVTKGPRLWHRFSEKYGEQSRVQNFFLGHHSLSSARAENLRRQLILNYPDLADRLARAEAAFANRGGQPVATPSAKAVDNTQRQGRLPAPTSANAVLTQTAGVLATRSTAVGAVAFSVPAGWRRSSSGDVTDLILTAPANRQFFQLRIFQPIQAQGVPTQTFFRLWESLIIPSFNTSFRPLPLRVRLRNGAALVYDGDPSTTLRQGNALCSAFLYMATDGSTVVPVVGVFQGWSDELRRGLDEFFGTLRIGNGAGPTPLFTLEDIAGHWRSSSSSLATLVDARGNYRGDASMASGESMTIRRDGSCEIDFASVGGAFGTMRQHDAGRCAVDDDMFVRPTERGLGRYRITGVGRSADGRNGFMLLGVTRDDFPFLNSGSGQPAAGDVYVLVP